MDLGRHHHRVTLPGALEPPADDLFAFAAARAVAVGRVDQVDPGGDRSIQDRMGFGFGHRIGEVVRAKTER